MLVFLFLDFRITIFSLSLSSSYCLLILCPRSSGCPLIDSIFNDRSQESRIHDNDTGTDSDLEVVVGVGARMECITLVHVLPFVKSIGTSLKNETKPKQRSGVIEVN